MSRKKEDSKPVPPETFAKWLMTLRYKLKENGYKDDSDPVLSVNDLIKKFPD